MIEAILNDIMEGLRAIEGMAEVDLWQGEIEDLMTKPKRLPGFYPIYQGAEFDEKIVIGANVARLRMEFQIVLIAQNLRSRAAGAITCFDLIEAARAVLIGRKIAPYGMLWPVKEDLIAVVSGTQVYGLTYRMKDVTA
jgi:hypothetical protein